jgi:hypothetical protein
MVCIIVNVRTLNLNGGKIMAIDIKQNTWHEPIEVREKVVQLICEAFLAPNCWSTYHPCSDGAYRRKHTYVRVHIGKGVGFTDSDSPTHKKDDIEFNGAEMKQAFVELRKAGWHMMRIYEYRTWKGYICCSRPYLEGNCWGNWCEVTELTDKVD